jgi:hypothetical protein
MAIALQILAFDVLHGQVMGQAGFPEVVKPADVPVRDLPGELELVLEALDRLFVEPDLGFDELEGDDLLDLLVVDLVDLAHAAPPELLDNLVAAGEDRAPAQVLEGSDHRPGEGGGRRRRRRRVGR